MFLIASNLTTRDARVEQIMRYCKEAGWGVGSEPAGMLKEIAKQCVAAGAEALEIDTQQHHDQPEAMEFAVRAVQEVSDLQLCLSSNSAETLDAGLNVCKKPPLVNYVSIDQSRLENIVPVAARRGAGIVLLVSDPASPGDAREMLQKAAVLVGVANGAGIPNDRIMVDPGLIHVTSEAGQRHLAEVIEFLRDLPDAVEPPVRSTCWLTNSSAGAPADRRPTIEASLLPMMAGAGLSSVFLDILHTEVRRAARLVRIFNDELVYSHSELDL